MTDNTDSVSYVVAIYARVSTKQQESVPEQIEACRRLCERLGHRVRYILRDEGASGASIERPGYQRLVELIKEQQIQGVVVWKLDRLIRSLRHMLNLSHVLESKDVALFSVTEQFDTSSAFGRFAFRTMASAAELERDIIGERSRLGRQTMASRGQWVGKHPPFGYRIQSDRQLEPAADEAEIVRRIFTMYKDQIPTTEIARRLEAQGRLGRGGHPLTTTQIAKIVRNPVYLGRLRILSTEHKRPSLRLINDGTWASAQARHGTRCDDGQGHQRTKAAMDRIFNAYIRHVRSGETD